MSSVNNFLFRNPRSVMIALAMSASCVDHRSPQVTLRLSSTMVSNSLNFPPLDHSLLFPDLINFHMEKISSFPIYVYANESAPDAQTEISLCMHFGPPAKVQTERLSLSLPIPIRYSTMSLLRACQSQDGLYVYLCAAFWFRFSHFSLAISGISREFCCGGC